MNDFATFASGLRTVLSQFITILDSAVIASGAKPAALAVAGTTAGDAKAGVVTTPAFEVMTPAREEAIRIGVLRMIQRAGTAGISRTKLQPATRGIDGRDAKYGTGRPGCRGRN